MKITQEEWESIDWEHLIQAAKDIRELQELQEEKKQEVCSMTDKEFLLWIADRLVYVHGDGENADFIWKLKAIAKRCGCRTTPNGTSPDNETAKCYVSSQ